MTENRIRILTQAVEIMRNLSFDSTLEKFLHRESDRVVKGVSLDDSYHVSLATLSIQNIAYKTNNPRNQAILFGVARLLIASGE